MWEIIVTLWICYFVLYVISLKIKDNSIVDVFWGTGFVIFAAILFFSQDNHNIFEIVFFLIFCIWWIRLTYHIGKRKLFSKKEDPRYAGWRQEWKYFKTRSFFQIYVLQMCLLLIIATPIYFIFQDEISGNISTILGIIIMIFGVSYEAIADAQLKKYLQTTQEKNKVFTGGLYKYSRHPNYFWESVFWLGISIISLQNSLFGMVWFLVITILLLFVSWVPLQEKRHKKKDNWEAYSSKTPKFIPNFFK